MVEKWIEKAQGSQVDRLGPHQLAQMINKRLSCARGFDLICVQLATSNVGGLRAPANRFRFLLPASCFLLPASAYRFRFNGATPACVLAHSASALSWVSTVGLDSGAALDAVGTKTSPSKSSKRVRARCGWRR